MFKTIESSKEALAVISIATLLLLNKGIESYLHVVSEDNGVFKVKYATLEGYVDLLTNSWEVVKNLDNRAMLLVCKGKGEIVFQSDLDEVTEKMGLIAVEVIG